MSDLQIVLILLGAIIIAGVVLFNWLQERKMRDDITEEFIVPQKDVLVEEFYIDTDAYVDKELSDVVNKPKAPDSVKTEPTITEKTPVPVESSTAAGASTPESIQTAPEIQPTTEPVQAEKIEQLSAEKETVASEQPAEGASTNTDSTDETVSQAAEGEKEATEDVEIEANYPKEIHPQIDLTAFLFASRNINAKQFSELVSKVAEEIGAPVVAHKLSADGDWQPHLFDEVDDADTFKQVACSIQLADRGGPTSKSVIHKFQFSIEEMGLDLGVHVEWQSTGDAVERAIALDKFCMEVDQLVNLHLIQEDAPVHGTKFKGLAEANSLSLNDFGQYCFYENTQSAPPLFILINGDDQPFTEESLRNNVIKRVSFQMEIPKINNCEEVFGQMVATAQRMATNMGARMVDDNQKVLGDAQIDKIKQQLKVIHATMLARGIMPGSAHSLRLFN